MTFLRMTENVTPDSEQKRSLANLREAVSVMRELGVLSWGDIVLGPAPVRPVEQAPQDQHSQASPETEDDDYAKTLLHSSGANPGPFLRKVVSK